jgi:hypothetical protein
MILLTLLRKIRAVILNDSITEVGGVTTCAKAENNKVVCEFRQKK